MSDKKISEATASQSPVLPRQPLFGAHLRWSIAVVRAAFHEWSTKPVTYADLAETLRGHTQPRDPADESSEAPRGNDTIGI